MTIHSPWVYMWQGPCVHLDRFPIAQLGQVPTHGWITPTWGMWAHNRIMAQEPVLSQVGPACSQKGQVISPGSHPSKVPPSSAEAHWRLSDWIPLSEETWGSCGPMFPNRSKRHVEQNAWSSVSLTHTAGTSYPYPTYYKPKRPLPSLYDTKPPTFVACASSEHSTASYWKALGFSPSLLKFTVRVLRPRARYKRMQAI